jgi:hypothetical protein
MPSVYSHERRFLKECGKRRGLRIHNDVTYVEWDDTISLLPTRHREHFLRFLCNSLLEYCTEHVTSETYELIRIRLTTRRLRRAFIRFLHAYLP